MKWPEEVMYRQEVDEYLAESVPGVIECSGISGDAYPTIIQFSAAILGNCKNLHSTACQLWQLGSAAAFHKSTILCPAPTWGDMFTQLTHTLSLTSAQNRAALLDIEEPKEQTAGPAARASWLCLYQKGQPEPLAQHISLIPSWVGSSPTSQGSLDQLFLAMQCPASLPLNFPPALLYFTDNPPYGPIPPRSFPTWVQFPQSPCT